MPGDPLIPEKHRVFESKVFGWIVKREKDNPVHLHPDPRRPQNRNLKKKMWVNVCSIKEPVPLNKVIAFVRETYSKECGLYSAQRNQYDFKQKRPVFQKPIIFLVSQNRK